MIPDMGEPAHGSSGIELLGDGNKRNGLSVEDLDHLGEVGQRSRQTVDVVDHYRVDQAIVDIVQEPLKRRSLHSPTGDATVVVTGPGPAPAFSGLAFG